MEPINKGMAKGAIWMIMFRLMNRSIGLVSTIILARLLIPADFGLVALATAITASVELLTAFNLDVVLIQNQSAERRHYDTAWTINAIMGLLLALLLCGASPVASAFYSEPRLENIIYVLAMGTFVHGLENIGVVEFRKDLTFHKDFYFRLIKKVVSFLTTVTLAYIFRSYWALVIGVLVSKFMGVALSYAMHAYRPRVTFEAWRELFHFSKWLFINNCIFFANSKSADFIIGKVSGPHGLGIYSLAYEISNLTSTELVAPINRAILPGYAKIASNLTILKQAYLNVIAAIAMLALPAGAGIALLAGPLVNLVLGAKWVDAIPIIQILAVSGVITALQANRGSVYLSLGKPRIMTYVTAIELVLLLPALTVGTQSMGIKGAAWAILMVKIVLLPINYMVLLRILRLKPIRLLAVLWRPIVATSLMAFAIKLVLGVLGEKIDLLGWVVQLASAISVGFIVYGGAVLILWRLAGGSDGVEALLMRILLRRVLRGKEDSRPV